MVAKAGVNPQNLQQTGGLMMPRKTIASHNGLRGVAALLVIFYHLQFGGGYRTPLETSSQFLPRGYLWVDLFFILSGFIISYAFIGDRTSAFTHREIKDFLVARLARIYPLHLFCLLYFVVFKAGLDLGLIAVGTSPSLDSWSGESLKRLGFQIFLLDSWGFTEALSWNVPAWSIGAEMFAYAAFPVIVAAMFVRPEYSRAIMIAIPLTFYGLIAVNSGLLDITFGMAPVRCLAGFLIGMLVYQKRDVFGRLSDTTLSAMQIMSVVVVLAVLVLGWNDVIIIPAFTILVASTSRDRGSIAHLLSRGPFAALGNLSYSMYLNHVPLMSILGFFWFRLAARLPMVPDYLLRSVWIIVVVGAVFVVSRLTYRYVELPARRHIMAYYRAKNIDTVPEGLMTENPSVQR